MSEAISPRLVAANDLIQRINKELEGVVYPDRRGAMLREASEMISSFVVASLAASKKEGKR